MADLSISFCGVRFGNPFTLSASCPSSMEMLGRAFALGWGAAVIRTTSLEDGESKTDKPLVQGYYAGGNKLIAMHSVGSMPRQHVDVSEREVRILKREYPAKVIIANIEGSLQEDLEGLARRLEAAGIDMIECSFLPDGLGQNVIAGQLANCAIERIKSATSRVPVISKLSSQVADMPAMAQALKKAGADGVTAVSSIKSLLGIDLDNFIPHPDVNGFSTFGELSGPAIKPIALRCVAEIAQAVDIGIAAGGGIATWQDALEFILVGARCLQVCTEVRKRGYGIIHDLVEGMGLYLEQKGYPGLEALAGRALPHLAATLQRPSALQVSALINKDKCTKCGACYLACRDAGNQAIELDMDKLPVINAKRCHGCNLCSTICPVKGCIEIKLCRPSI